MGGTRLPRFLLLLPLFFGSPSWAAVVEGESEGSSTSSRIEREGIVVELSLDPVAPGAAGEIREGQDVAFRFAISDTATGTPLSGVYPAAWMDPLGEQESPDPSRCQQLVEEYVGGSVLTQAELDLNVYYVLALNADATITVVDPLFGFGGTKLLDLVSLRSPGEDWHRSLDRSMLFVSQPDSGLLAAISTADWKVRRHLDVGPRPGRLALQADGAYLWVAADSQGADSGVRVVDTRSLEVVARIATGRGRHEIAIGDDNRWAWVTNSSEGTVSVIDVRELRKVRDLETGMEPASIAYSTTAQAAYVSHRGDGTIVVIDGASGEITNRIQAQPGIGQIRFAPGGRLALVPNPEQDTVDIIDSASNRIVQTADVFDRPDQIAFSEELAYIRHLGSEIVLMVPLAELGKEGKPVPVIDFPAGQEPFGRGGRPILADAIVQAPGATAVLLANPADRMIYYYKEGMAAPMGGFRNYDRQPRAVQVIDRSLRERRQPGVYETAARLRGPGRYQVAFFLDTPRIVHCFETVVAVDPELEKQRQAARPVQVQPLFEVAEVVVGQPVPLRYRLTDPHTQQPITGLRDVTVLTYTTGNWSRRQMASEVGDGVYEVSMTPPVPGAFYISVECLSQRLPFHRAGRIVLHAVAPAEQAAPAASGG